MKKIRSWDSEYILRWAKKIRAVNILGGKCSKCGNDNIFNLEFHHLRNKLHDIQSLSGGRWSKIEKEIESCILLCRNCHSEHFSESFNKKDDKNIIARNRNIKIKQKLLLIKNVTSCQRCGYKGINDSSLVFHHSEEDKKSFSVNVCSIRRKIKWEDVLLEIEKCEVICQNCHIKEHTDIEKFNKLKDLIYKKVNNIKELPKPYDKKEIIKMYDGGMKQIEIVRKLGCCKGTVSMILSAR